MGSEMCIRDRSKANKGAFSVDVSQATSISGNLAPDTFYDSAMRKRTYANLFYRYDLKIYSSMTGVEGKRRLLSGGTGFLAISGIVVFP